jgi:predicted lipoprotein
MEIIAGIASVLGVITGLWFFIDKIRKPKTVITWREEEKIISSEWVELSGTKALWESKGFTLVWANNRNVEEYLLKGYILAIEENNEKLVKYKLVSSGQVLMAKPKT